MSEAVKISDLRFSYPSQTEEAPLRIFDGLNLTI